MVGLVQYFTGQPCLSPWSVAEEFVIVHYHKCAETDRPLCGDVPQMAGGHGVQRLHYRCRSDGNGRRIGRAVRVYQRQLVELFKTDSDSSRSRLRLCRRGAGFQRDRTLALAGANNGMTLPTAETGVHVYTFFFWNAYVDG